MKTFKANQPLHFLFKSMIPGLLGVFMLIIETPIHRLLIHLKNQEYNIVDDDGRLYVSSWSIRLSELAFESVKSLSTIIFESYNNYFSFMLMMLFFHVFLQGLAILRKYLVKKEDSSCWLDSKLIHKQLQSTFIKNILGYTLLYFAYQVLWTGIIYLLPTNHPTIVQAPNELLKSLNEDHYSQWSNRILTEEPSSIPIVQDEIKVSQKKPSLSIGKVKSEVDIETTSMILSKDEKIIFAVTNGGQKMLKILDVSDMDIPKILSSQLLSKSIYDLQSLGLCLSSDETKLFISNGDALEVFDVSDLSSPFKIALAQDKRTKEKESSLDIDISTRLSILKSKDDEFVFAAGLGLQIFDISILIAPLSVSSVHSQITSGKLVPSSIALSQDKRTLYYTDGSLWIYDVSDPVNLKVIKSFNTSFTISSMKLSKDAKTAYILGRSADKKVVLQKLEISDSLSIKTSETFQFDQMSSSAPVFLEQSPRDLFLLIQIQDPINKSLITLVFDANQQEILMHQKMLINDDASSVLFTKVYQKLFVGSDRRGLKIVNLYLDFPNKNSFCGTNNILQTFEVTGTLAANTFPSSDGSFLYSWNGTRGGSSSTFSIQRFMPNSSKLLTIPLYQSAKGSIYSMTVSPDNQIASWFSSEMVYIMNISNTKNVTIISQYQREATRFLKLYYFALSQDGKTGYLSYGYDNMSYPVRTIYNLVEIFDFSNPKVPTRKSATRIEHESGCLLLSKDEKTLFVSGLLLVIYNVSNSSAPALLANISLLATGIDKTWGQMILSHDEKLLFIKEEQVISYVALRIIDVSNLTSPKVLSSLRLPLKIQDPSQYSRLALSSDSKTAYLMNETYIVVIDVSNPSLPRYLGAIKTINSKLDFRLPFYFQQEPQDYIGDFRLSVDGENAIVATQNGKVHIVSLEPIYSTYISQDVVMLGESYRIDTMVLKKDQKKIYNKIDVDYKLIKFSLVEAYSSQSDDFAAITFKLPPPWIRFDFKSQTLLVDPRGKNDIRVHKVSFTFSTKVPQDLFVLSLLVSPKGANNFTALLIRQGYLDNQFFLTEKFGAYEDFLLPSEHKDIQQQVYYALKQFTIQTFNEFEVVSSLNLTSSDKLAISTSSRNSLKVEIMLRSGQFLTKHYSSLVPTIIDKNTRIVFEGSLNEVNIALQEIVINFENDLMTSCDGQVIVDDKLNPIINKSIQNISRFFRLNSQPGFSQSIQSQIEKYLPLFKGHYFQMKLNDNTFFDEHTPIENLNYQLVLIEKDNPEITVPYWISFSDMTLTGVVPETLSDQEYTFNLIVKNQFKQLQVSFTLKVDINWNFIFKVFMQYLPYALSLLGFILKKNQIMNIIAKNAYKHQKEFYLSVGQKITPEVIFPIFFISQEKKEAEKILKYLKKGIADEYKVGSGNINELLTYFTDKETDKLDKQKLIKKAREYCYLSEEKERIDELELYLNGSDVQKLTIDQLIVNTLVMKQLQMNRETKKLFEEIKSQWPIFVEWNSSVSGFQINQQLSGEPSINQDLLENAILAYAFDCQSLKISSSEVHLQIKEKTKAILLERFFKLDLLDSYFHGAERVGYGIRYKKSCNRLFFYGVVKKDFKDKTLIIEIKNEKDRILKEIFIHSS